MTIPMSRSIDVWSVDLEAPAAAVERFASLLAPGETERANRFRFEHLRRHFTVARGALRIFLGRYLGVAPANVELSTGPRGKPAVVAAEALSFNVSHSGTIAMFAFTRGGEIGVDVEAMRPMPDLLDLANRFFCAEETAELMSLPAPDRERAFFRCWTRKESYIKAIGEGLHVPLDRFRVTLRPEEGARFVHIDHDESVAAEWMLHDLQAPATYAAALAYRDAVRPVHELPLMRGEELFG